MMRLRGFAACCAVLLGVGCPADDPVGVADADTTAETAVDADAIEDGGPDDAVGEEVTVDLCADVECPVSPVPCTINRCQPESGTCAAESLSAGDPCDRDEDVCTLDVCDGAGFCVFLQYDTTSTSCEPPCVTDADCDDNDACTSDTCSPQVGCVNQAIDCGTTCGPIAETLGCGDVAVAVDGVEGNLLTYDCDGEPTLSGSDVAYAFTAAEDGLIRVEVDAQPLEYAHVAVLEGTCATTACATVSGLTLENNAVIWPVTAGTQYFIVIDSAVGGVLSVASVWLQCSAGESCSNGTDDDWDELVDCADPDCPKDGAPCQEIETLCADGLDNDADGTTDCADLSCDGIGDCEAVEVSCDDGIDNDGNGTSDCFDVSCVPDAACITTCDDAVEVIDCGWTQNGVATTTNSYLAHSCAPGDWPNPDVLLSLTPPETGTVTVGIETTNEDTVIVVLEGDCASGACLGMWEPIPFHFHSDAAQFEVTGGTTYIIVVDANVPGSKPGESASYGQLAVTCTPDGG